MKQSGKRHHWKKKTTGMLTVLALLAAAASSASALPESPARLAAAPAALVSAAPSAEEPAAAPETAAPEAAARTPAPNVPDVPADPRVPESAPVETGYFEDAVLLGDSRTEGFFLYSGQTEGVGLYAVGATVESVFTKPTQETDAGKVPLLDALADIPCGKVYIMLGINELGWSRSENFRNQYALLIDRVRADHPDATVVIQSILPVSAVQEAKGSYVNNARIAEYNALLLDLAVEKHCPYLDVASAVTGEDGCLRPELTGDGVHLNVAGCQTWRTYLQTHEL